MIVREFNRGDAVHGLHGAVEQRRETHALFVKATLIKYCSSVVFTCTVAVQTNRQMKMKQQTLAMAADQAEGFEPYRRPTRRDTFLATMQQIGKRPANPILND